MPAGYNGRILRVDLSTGCLDVEQPGDEFYRHYWGGRGMIAYYLLREQAAGTPALGPDNLLIFATGPLTGGPFGGGGRHSVGARSPLTGAFGESEAGGYWGAELKRAGFDAVVVKGCAARPTYLWLHDGQVEIRDAGHLWGLPTADAQARLAEELGDNLARMALIGPAGENQVPYACIMHDLKHAAGRTGMGAVMGSKKLKAIVVRGHAAPAPADAEAVRGIGKRLSQAVASHPGMKWLQLHGTAGGLTGLNALGVLPTRNFQDGTFAGAEALCGETLTKTLLTGRGSCFACPIRCKRVVQPQPGWEFDPRYGGPEYETIAAFGSNCGVDNLAAVAKANALCSAYGLDTISTGVTIAFALECYERGLLSDVDTGGLKLCFGSAEAVLQLIELIARREGLGELLSLGTRRAAERIGGEARGCAMHVLGQEIPLQEPRLAHHRAVGYVVNAGGADHLAGAPENFFEKEGPRLEAYRTLGTFHTSSLHGFEAEKLRLYVYSHIWNSFTNCAVLCLFVPYTFHQVRQLVQGMTGWDTSVWELMKTGERASTMARAFNVREGLVPADARLPDRFCQRLQTESAGGAPVDRVGLERAAGEFYGMMGWEPHTARPTLGKLQELGIAWVADQLH